MANLSQTPANVKIMAASAARVRVVQGGEAITQGMPVYQAGGDNKWYQADANASAAAAAATAIALTPCGIDGYFVIAETGTTVDLGATLTVGTTYVVSATKGAIAPIADLTTGDYTTILGTATAAGSLPLNISSSGVAKP